jgi:hypothetical protein
MYVAVLNWNGKLYSNLDCGNTHFQDAFPAILHTQLALIFFSPDKHLLQNWFHYRYHTAQLQIIFVALGKHSYQRVYLRIKLNSPDNVSGDAQYQI